MKTQTLIPACSRSFRFLLTVLTLMAGGAMSGVQASGAQASGAHMTENQMTGNQATENQLTGTPAGSPTAANLPAGTAPERTSRSALSNSLLSRPVLPGAFALSRRLQQLRGSASVAAPSSPIRTPVPALATGKYRFVNITIPNSIGVELRGINNAGVVIGVYQDTAAKAHGFVWTNGKVQTVDYPGAISTVPSGLNNRGELVATYLTTSDTDYDLYRVATYSLATSTWTALPEIPGGWPEQESGQGITDEGVVTGCAEKTLASGGLSWVWHPDTETYSYLSDPAASEAATCAEAISYNGDIVGTYSTVYGANFTFLENTQGDYETLLAPSNLPGAQFNTFAVNDSETIAGVFEYAYTDTGFVRTSAGVISLVKQPGFAESAVYGMNDSGVLCGNSFSNDPGVYVSFIAYPE